MLYRNMIVVLSIIILFTSSFAQKHDRMKPMQKMEELKKIKLIEILQMDEETNVKFFTRRSEHIKKIESLNFASQQKIEQIAGIIEDGKESNSTNLKKAIDEYLQLQENVMQERQNFFKSASEILTIEQLGKLVVFEEKFRNEVSGLLFRERNKRLRDNQTGQ
jgi:hypothetical protein